MDQKLYRAIRLIVQEFEAHPGAFVGVISLYDIRKVIQLPDSDNVLGSDSLVLNAAVHYLGKRKTLSVLANWMLNN